MGRGSLAVGQRELRGLTLGTEITISANLSSLKKICITDFRTNQRSHPVHPLIESLGEPLDLSGQMKRKRNRTNFGEAGKVDFCFGDPVWV